MLQQNTHLRAIVDNNSRCSSRFQMLKRIIDVKDHREKLKSSEINKLMLKAKQLLEFEEHLKRLRQHEKETTKRKKRTFSSFVVRALRKRSNFAHEWKTG